MNFPICESGNLWSGIAYLRKKKRARAIARACGVAIEKSELRLVAGEEYPKEVLAYWRPAEKRTQLACLWALTHHAPAPPGAWPGLCRIRRWIGERRKRRKGFGPTACCAATTPAVSWPGSEPARCTAPTRSKKQED